MFFGTCYTQTLKKITIVGRVDVKKKKHQNSFLCIREINYQNHHQEVGLGAPAAVCEGMKELRRTVWRHVRGSNF